MDVKKEYTAQELAIEFYNIDWVSVQVDSQLENEKVMFLLSRLEKLPSKHAIRILLNVIEVISLDARFIDNKDNPFRDMNKFLYLNKNLNNWPTDDYIDL